VSVSAHWTFTWWRADEGLGCAWQGGAVTPCLSPLFSADVTSGICRILRTVWMGIWYPWRFCEEIW
jgi:hypothetical protein